MIVAHAKALASPAKPSKLVARFGHTGRIGE